MTMPKRRIQAARLGIIGGYLLLAAGVFGDGRLDLTDLRALGLGTLVGSALWVGLDFYESVRQCAYDDGYADCQRTIIRFPEPPTLNQDQLTV